MGAAIRGEVSDFSLICVILVSKQLKHLSALTVGQVNHLHCYCFQCWQITSSICWWICNGHITCTSIV